MYCHFFNICVDKSQFPSVLKHANTTPVFKKGHRCSKENYRPVSILPVIYKIFEKLLCHQIKPFMDQFLLSTNVAFESGSLLRIVFLPCGDVEKSSWHQKSFWLIYQKHSTVCHMALLLLIADIIVMDLVFLH